MFSKKLLTPIMTLVATSLFVAACNNPNDSTSTSVKTTTENKTTSATKASTSYNANSAIAIAAAKKAETADKPVKESAVEATKEAKK